MRVNNHNKGRDDDNNRTDENNNKVTINIYATNQAFFVSPQSSVNDICAEIVGGGGVVWTNSEQVAVI